VRSIVYDTGALVAAQHRDERFHRIHRNRLASGDARILIPVVVLAQAWRGGPQAEISRILGECEIVPDTEAVGRAAGVACARAGTSDVVDAIVVVTALSTESAVVTSDPRDLLLLARSLGRKLDLLVV